ncbi:MAG: ATP-grasp domain-containing protein [Candidatus Eremiobacteraeota bacterium]|nr:ATP-grasp domain-containing protein [Candidatus Eremiobacteraeota bacterium]
MREIIVGVSGINAVDNPGPGIGVARALLDDKDLNVKIVGLAYDGMEPGIYLDWLIDRSYIMPYPSGGYDAFIKRLEYIKASFGLDFIIPNLDSELPLYAKYSEKIEKLGIGVFVPTLKQFHLRAKNRLAEVAEKIGIKIPQTEVVTSHDELVEAVEKIGLPVMVKGALYKAYRAHTTQQAIEYYNKIVAEWGYPIVVQQVVSGEEMNVVGVGDGEGNSLGMLGIRKLWITSLGKIWTGVSIRNQKMLNAASSFIHTYNWKGAFELECISNNGDVYLIEINPRFPAWSYFAAGVGLNLPSNMLRKAFGLPISQNMDYKVGKLYVRYTYEVITDLQPFQEIMTKGEW